MKEKIDKLRIKAKETKAAASEALHEIPQEIKNSIQQFKEESEQKIIAIEKRITQLKVKIENNIERDQAIYQEKVKELEQKGSDLKKKLNDFKLAKKDQWKFFKNEFNSDLNNLRTALKNFVIKDK